LTKYVIIKPNKDKKCTQNYKREIVSSTAPKPLMDGEVTLLRLQKREKLSKPVILPLSGHTTYNNTHTGGKHRKTLKSKGK